MKVSFDVPLRGLLFTYHLAPSNGGVRGVETGGGVDTPAPSPAAPRGMVDIGDPLEPAAEASVPNMHENWMVTTCWKQMVTTCEFFEHENLQ